MSIRVLVVDDQQLVRSGFRMILESEPDLTVVGEAGDGDAGIAAARELAPDVVLMDIRMPGTDGIEATRQLVGAGVPTDTRVIILTTFDLDDYVFGALEAGASGFLLKDTPPAELVRAVRVVASGDALVSPSVTRRLIEQFVATRPNGAAQPSASSVVEPPLTAREVEVLEAMAQGWSNAEIAAELFVSETTVKTHVGHILTKLGVRDRVQAVVWAHRHGVAPVGDPQPGD